MMQRSVEQLIASYDPARPLAEACTIPSAWYTDPRIDELERRTVFSGSWQVVARLDQLSEPGQFVTVEAGGEPLVIVRDGGGALRGFFNVCRHHAAPVAVGEAGHCTALRCGYHGWTYALDGQLKSASEFEGVRNFDKGSNGLVPVQIDTWERWVFARLDEGPDLATFLGGLKGRVAALGIGKLRFFERRVYELGCNWKVFVDNYLDGGYHVPYAHKSLGSVLDYANYIVECEDRCCTQSSPMTTAGADAATASVRRGDMAYYFWLYPNFMINWYEGVMDTNLVIPMGPNRMRVIFDFFFSDDGAEASEGHRRSIAVSDRVQQEDILLCEWVQRGLHSRAYDVGRFSVRREAGEHLFHRLLHADLAAGCAARG